MRRSLGSNGNEPKAFRTFTERRLGFEIDLRFKNGNRRSFSYVDMVEKEYNVDLGGIMIESFSKRITILGINLEGLYEQILDHEVGEITERHVPENMIEHITNQDECYISKIDIEVLR